MAALKLVYLPIRGLAESTRLALHDQGIPFDNVLTSELPGGWPALKKAGYEDGSLPFAQTPQLIDGTLNIVQSKTILRHLGRTHNLYGATEEEHCYVDLIVDAVGDARMRYVNLVYTARLEAGALTAFKAAMVEGTIAQLERWFLLRRPVGAEWISAATITIGARLDALHIILRLAGRHDFECRGERCRRCAGCVFEEFCYYPMGTSLAILWGHPCC